MAKILELRQKRSNAWNACKKFLDEHPGAMSAEDSATYDRMEADVTAMGTEIERLERAEAMDRELNQPVNAPATSRPDRNETEDPARPRASAAYRTAFDRYVRNRVVPFEIRNALEAGEDSEGGYLVPDEYDAQLIQALDDENIFRPLAHVIRTSGGDRKIPVVTSRGTASWVDEEGAIPDTDNAFGIASLSAFKLAAMVKISEELLADSAFNMQAYLVAEIARRIGAAEEESFFTGNGSGKPTGLFAASGGASAGITTASATAITADEIFDLFYSLRAPYRRKAVWLLNDSTVKLLRKLKDSTGQYLWAPGMTAGQPDTLLNRPVKTSTFVPAATAGLKSVAFGDLSYYWIGDRQSRTLKRLGELYAVNGQVGFLATQRVDGKLMLAEAVKVLTQHA